MSGTRSCSSSTDSVSLSTRLASELESHGFGLCDSFHPHWYNEWVRSKQAGLLELREQNVTNAFLIGNTKRMWPMFKEWYRSLPQQQKPDHPIDAYCQSTITEAVQTIAAKSNQQQKYDLHLSSTHEMDRMVSMQRVAALSGTAYFDPQSHLAIHPQYGTWVSYRAVVIFYKNDDVTNNTNREPVPPPKLLPCPLTKEEQEMAQQAFQTALQKQSDLAKSNNQNMSNCQVVDAWIALRDCIPIGKEYRFDRDQILYHYTKDIKYLDDDDDDDDDRDGDARRR